MDNGYRESMDIEYSARSFFVNNILVLNNKVESFPNTKTVWYDGNQCLFPK